ncbi:hypothetical protein BN1080_00414 [Planococcus massiliensis]|uniref:Uncharacterized protein n=1 Tax=Planococcus massiliensis TaxID=1499687 RepID=A0A098EGW0_9BACL|nr:hypothetical protein [Planococcus massiliensis]CEG21503.1 hypothetical protein BN1080_00414 [Planococcus massiliensis]
MSINFKGRFHENIKIIDTLLSPSHPNFGILIAGEDYFHSSKQPIIRVYLIYENNSEWHIQKELEAFSFSNYSMAKQFISDLPKMSALDLLLLMNGWQKNNPFLQ